MTKHLEPSASKKRKAESLLMAFSLSCSPENLHNRTKNYTLHRFSNSKNKHKHYIVLWRSLNSMFHNKKRTQLIKENHELRNGEEIRASIQIIYPMGGLPCSFLPLRVAFVLKNTRGVFFKNMRKRSVCLSQKSGWLCPERSQRIVGRDFGAMSRSQSAAGLPDFEVNALSKAVVFFIMILHINPLAEAADFCRFHGNAEQLAKVQNITLSNHCVG